MPTIDPKRKKQGIGAKQHFRGKPRTADEIERLRKQQARGWGNYDKDTGDLKRPGWKKAKEIAKAAGKVFCEVCDREGRVNAHIEIHHINGERTDNRFTNLQALCPEHHREVHRGGGGKA